MSITTQDVPNMEGFVHADKFYEIEAYLSRTDIRQIMSYECWKHWDCPMMWKLFGCMVNRFGVCTPTSSQTNDKTMSFDVMTRPPILSIFQLQSLKTNGKHVLVFRNVIPFHPNDSDRHYLLYLYNCISNLEAKKAIQEIALPEIALIIYGYCILPTTLECTTYDQVSTQQNQIQENAILSETSRKRKVAQIQDAMEKIRQS